MNSFKKRALKKAKNRAKKERPTWFALCIRTISSFEYVVKIEVQFDLDQPYLMATTDIHPRFPEQI